MTEPGLGGLAPERTRLAWRRTALGIAAGSIATGRLLQELVGPGAWALAVVGVAASAVVLVGAIRRHRAPVGRPPTPSGGWLVTASAVGVLALGVAALAAVLGAV